MGSVHATGEGILTIVFQITGKSRIILAFVNLVRSDDNEGIVSPIGALLGGA